MKARTMSLKDKVFLCGSKFGKNKEFCIYAMATPFGERFLLKRWQCKGKLRLSNVVMSPDDFYTFFRKAEDDEAEEFFRNIGVKSGGGML